MIEEKEKFATKEEVHALEQRIFRIIIDYSEAIISFLSRLKITVELIFYGAVGYLFGQIYNHFFN